MKNTKILISLHAVVFMSTLVLAQSASATQITGALGEICNLFAAVLPVIGFVLFVLAGVAYAAGNFFTAEIRAKATSWAMNMILGAIISFLLWIVAPTIIGALSPGNLEYTVGATGCTGPGL